MNSHAMNTKRNIPRHILKPLKAKDKEEILQTERRKQLTKYNTVMLLMTDFSLSGDQRHWNDILKMLK